ncbi:hypothetical protein ACWDOP_32455 [Nocardia sp. NPDC003693]
MVAVRRMWWGMLAVPVLAVAGCGDPDPTPDEPGIENVALGADFTLAPRDVAVADENRLRVRFDEVTGDSRCPEDVDCVWAGTATIVVTVTAGAGESRQELHLNPNTGVTVEGYRIDVRKLAPARRTDRAISAGDYRVTLVANRS